jgi:hypothetical protein
LEDSDLQTLNRTVIRAPWKRVYDAAERIVSWPRLLPHYRWVSIFEDHGRRRQVEMAAQRSGFPCKWQSLQVLYPHQKKIYYLHTRSFWSQGMEVWWTLKPQNDGSTEVSITHDMPPAGNPVLAWFRQHIVGDFFVVAIADKTLAGLKRHLEQT